ncbi:MAG: hypothetical protein AAF367_17805 [Pseudomonadota bacterium]
METATTILDVATWWGWIGLAVAAVFLTIGIDRIDENARGAYVFRPLLLPAVILIWPLVLWRWIVLETGRDHWPNRHRPPRRAHRYVALVFAIMMPAVILTGIAIKQTWPEGFTPVQLSEPGE